MRWYTEKHCRNLAGSLLAAGAILGAIAAWAEEPATDPGWPELSFSKSDRILVLAPHPDDESLACAGVIQEAVAMKLPLRVVFLTYGDVNQWSFIVYRKRPVLTARGARAMGLVRHDEAVAAADVLGVPRENLSFLGYPDFGTMKLWTSHWDDQPPLRSILTKATAVPYKNARRPGAPYRGDEVLRDVESIIREFRPTKIFVSHPGDVHPDHRALYLFTRVALLDLERDVHPALYPYLVHYKNWPTPRQFAPEEPLRPPSPFDEQIPWQALPLSPAENEVKRKALECHRTQYKVSANYLLSFVRANELFGDFPTLPPPPAEQPEPSIERTGRSSELPEELTDEEKALFVGVETRAIRLEGNDLVLTVNLSRPLAKAVEAEILIFGYRSDREFPKMPKLRVQLGALGHKVLDQDRELPPETISVSRQENEFAIRVPLAAAGDPDDILTAGHTYLGDVPLDWISWRVLRLPPRRAPAGQPPAPGLLQRLLKLR